MEIADLLKRLHGALYGRERALGCFDVCDADGDGEIQIHEIILAVNYALDGCP